MRCKARIVIAGHRDIDSENGMRTDAPIVTRISTYILLLICASNQFIPIAADVEAAFLQGKDSERLSNRVYLRQPKEGFPGLEPQQLIGVRKGLFGFADSPRMWWLHFR